MSITTDIIFHGELGLRFAFVGEFTIREILDYGNGYKIHRWDIFVEHDDEETLTHSTNTLDAALCFVTQRKGGRF